MEMNMFVINILIVNIHETRLFRIEAIHLNFVHALDEQEIFLSY